MAIPMPGDAESPKRIARASRDLAILTHFRSFGQYPLGFFNIFFNWRRTFARKERRCRTEIHRCTSVENVDG